MFPTSLHLPLPLLIFAAEMCVVTVSTIRIIFVSRGYKGLASALGLFEISIWLFAIGQVMKNLDSLPCHAAFASGFVLGNYLGIIIEKRLAIGTLVVRTITHRDATGLIFSLRRAHYGVTALDAEGATGPVKVVFSVIPRKHLAHVLGIIRAFDDHAFYSVDEVQSASPCRSPAHARAAGLARGLIPGALLPARRAG